MTAKILSGTQIAAEIREELKGRVSKLKQKGVTPALAVVLVGEDPASVSYVTSKAKGAEEIGMHEETIRLPADTSEEKVMQTVDKLNKDPKFHGILVQLPLPKHISTDKVISCISSEKDVDGFHPVNGTLPAALHPSRGSADTDQKWL
jgi:methylenetetrahydrofolate dehydrogenase (NADP+)/methenyltetrahydrofolate cyclohydrolase